MKLMVVVVPLFLAVTGCQSAPQQTPATVRVGTFHAPSLVVAYYRSELHAKDLAGMAAARDAAVKAGDAAKAGEIEKRGAEMQDLAHRQLSGEAGIAAILERLKADLPAIAREADVRIIVTHALFLGVGVENVDVTAALVERLHPDQETLRILAELQQASNESVQRVGDEGRP
jgi:hypothetical protein